MLYITGAEKYRAFWKHYYKGAEAIIYVVDAACPEAQLSTSKDALHDALCSPELRDLPLLVLANCQDKAGARTGKQVCVYCLLKHIAACIMFLVTFSL